MAVLPRGKRAAAVLDAPKSLLKPRGSKNDSTRADRGQAQSEHLEVVTAQRCRMATPAELANFLQVPVKSLYQWRYEGKGPHAYRVGRHLRYRWEDVESWLATTVGGAR